MLGFSDSLADKGMCLQCRRPWFNYWVGKICSRRDRLPTPVFLGFPGGLDGKESTCSAGGLGSIPGLGRFPGGGHGNPVQNFSLENPHGSRSLVGYSSGGHKSRTGLSDFHFHFSLDIIRGRNLSIKNTYYIFSSSHSGRFLCMQMERK